MGLHGKEIRCRTVGQIPKNVKKPQTWLSLIWLISFFFVCWNLFCTIANLRIKCVTETKNVSVLIYKNLKIKLSTWLTHLTLRVFLHFWLLWPTARPMAAATESKRNKTEKNHIIDNHIKFEVSLHYWGIWPTVRHAT